MFSCLAQEKSSSRSLLDVYKKYKLFYNINGENIKYKIMCIPSQEWCKIHYSLRKSVWQLLMYSDTYFYAAKQISLHMPFLVKADTFSWACVS